MARREVCFLIGRGGAVLWADASSSPIALPDSRARWERIWGHRAELEEIAHSHPVGPLGFSSEDVSTMEALGIALGRRLAFSVVTPEAMVRRTDGGDAVVKVEEEPFWVELLRSASGMRQEGET